MQIEILAPAGSVESLTAAVRCGANAVYLGTKNFNARRNADNFDGSALKSAVEYCHQRNVKVYLTANTLVADDEMSSAYNTIKTALEYGVDAFIVQDLGVAKMIRQCFPSARLHASTQCSVNTPDGVNALKELGFKRIVVPREMSLDEIKEIREKTDVELEMFVHGALCMCVSGQCYMSAMLGGRSGNRGLCAQPCRLSFSADNSGSFDLSLKDLSLIDKIKEIESAGIISLKIEGRMKRPEYVAAAVNCCKNSLENKPYDLKALEAVFSRGGFSDGYYNGRLGREMFGTRQKEDVSATAKILPELHELYRRCEKRTKAFFTIKLQEKSQAELSLRDSEGNTVTVYGDIPQKALKKACDSDYVKKQLSKLGDTIYEFGGLEAAIGKDLAYPASALNDLRRQAVEKLDQKRIDFFTHTADFTDKSLADFSALPKAYERKKIRIMLSKLSQLEGVDLDNVELVGVPIEIASEAAKIVSDKSKLMIIMPRFTFDEKALCEKLSAAKEAGITKMLAMNIGHCLIANDLGFELHSGYSFNLCNSAALDEVKKLGAKDCTVSFELKASQIEKLKKPIEIGFVAYGRLPLMLTANCPIRNDMGCKNCKGKLFDRTGREFTVRCPKGRDCAEILNSDILYLADKLDDFDNADYMELHFYEENAHRINEIIKAYSGERGAKPENATNGLYYRGVL